MTAAAASAIARTTRMVRSDRMPASLSERLEAQGLAAGLVAEARELEARAAAWQRLTVAAGTISVTDTAKILDIAPRRLIHWLLGHEWLFRLASGELSAHQDKITARLLTQRVHSIIRGDGSARFVPQVAVTAKGLTRLDELLGREQGRLL
jgi:phage antirepressor YoqD-like protein